MQGNQLAREILAIRPDFPVLLAVGYSKIIAGESILKEGVKGLLQKQFSEEQLLKMIGEVLTEPEIPTSMPIDNN